MINFIKKIFSGIFKKKKCLNNFHDAAFLETIRAKYQEFRVNGKLHREDGPAIIYENGGERWYLNDKLHREDGPAVIREDGTQYWYLNGILHREDGPAVIYADGTQHWYLNGKLHR